MKELRELGLKNKDLFFKMLRERLDAIKAIGTEDFDDLCKKHSDTLHKLKEIIPEKSISKVEHVHFILCINDKDYKKLNEECLVALLKTELQISRILKDNIR